MRPRRRLSLTLVAGLTLAVLGATSGRALALPLLAGEAIVVISVVRGEIGEIERQLIIRDDVYQEEVIETEPRSVARLLLRDDTEVSIGPESRLVLDRFVYDPDRKVGALSLEMVEGVFGFLSGLLSKESYDLRTSFATLGVRGTDIAVDTERDIIHVFLGLLLVRLANDEAYVVAAGECLLDARAGRARLLDGAACYERLDRYFAMRAALDFQEQIQAQGATCRDPGTHFWLNLALVSRRWLAEGSVSLPALAADPDVDVSLALIDAAMREVTWPIAATLLDPLADEPILGSALGPECVDGTWDIGVPFSAPPPPQPLLVGPVLPLPPAARPPSIGVDEPSAIWTLLLGLAAVGVIAAGLRPRRAGR